MKAINGINKYRKALDVLSKEQSLCKWYLYLDCIWSRIRYGCVLNHYVVGNFYKRCSFDRKRIYTYRHWCKVVNKVNDSKSIHILKEKVDFNNYFLEYLGRDWLYSKKMSLDSFDSFCKKHDCAIIKPMSGLEGEGVVLKSMPKESNDIIKLYKQYSASDVLIEEKIIQHPEMVFGNKSVNTIRIYTTLNDKTNEVSIIKTVVRAGIGESIVDNSHSGGCAYEIDKELGYIISSYYAANGQSSYIHPGTDICMIGRKIPYWSEVKEICVKAALKLPKCRYIGWDVAITIFLI